MNSLLRCIQIALLAAFWPSLTLASPGSGRDDDRDREYADDDSSGRGSGRDDSDDRYDAADDERDDDDRDNSESGSRDAEYDAVYYEDRAYDGDSGSGSGGDYERAESDNSESGGDYDNSGSGSGDYGSDSSGSGSGDYSSDNSGSGSDDYGSDSSGSGSGDYSSDNSGSGSGDYGSDGSGSGSGDYSSDNSGSGSGDYGSDGSGSGSGDYSSDNSGSGSGDYGSDGSGSGSGDYSSDNSGSGSDDYGSDSSGSGSGDYTSNNSGPDSDDDGDNSGSGSDDYDDDNSGSGSGDYDDDNSGSGDSDGDNDNPGSGSGGDDDDDDYGYDDHSGSGSGGGYEDDNSGSGSGSGGHDYGDNNSNSNSGPGSGASASESGTFEMASSVDHHIDTPIEVSRDAEGREYVRDEALMLCAPSDVAIAVAQGFELISERRLASDGRVVVRLLTPAGMDIDAAVAALRAAAPAALVSRNTVFRSAQASSLVAASPSRRSQVQTHGLLGIVDTGADTNFLRRGTVVATRAFAAPTYTPREHGSVVASIASASGVRVQIADVFSVASDGEIAASADAIVAALDWMIESGVPVINVSIEGPENPLLTAIVHTATARGHIIVAAAGNGGPLGRPVFPAALDGAVAVTAVDDTGHAYRRANRGDYISFAARGVDLEVNLGADVVTVSGTSFAAPFVAARLASHYHSASPVQARAALDAMRASAVDLGRPGRDPVFGWGWVSD